ADTAFLKKVKEQTTASFENQEYPFEMLVEEISIARDTGRNPLFDVMFSFENMDIPALEIKSLKASLKDFAGGAAKFDLNLSAVESSDCLLCKFEYCTKLFKQETIERFIVYFKEAVSAIVNNAGKEMAEIEIIPPEEKNRLLFEFNDTGVAFSVDKTIHRLFEEQTERAPDRVAILAGPIRQVCLTYRELNKQSGGRARGLLEKGVLPDSIVGIMIERSIEMVIGIMGILKSGGAYMPIDPQYPPERIEYMLKDSGAKILINKSETRNPKFAANPNDPNKNDRISNLSPSNLVYVIYTSGTTGKPKGAGVFHRGFSNLIHWFVTAFDLNAQDRNILLTSLSFDLTQKNIFSPLVTGGALTFPTQDYFDPHDILQAVEKKRVTWFNCTPGMIYKIIDYSSEEDLKKLFSLRYVFLGGEPIALKVLGKWVESRYCNAQIVNTYGPTECTDICASYTIKEPGRFQDENVPTGKPIYNVNLYVLGRWFQLLPVGVTGELIIGGEGVGLGYLNHPELTAERFQFNRSYRTNKNYIVYNTGDLCKWLPDGNIEFVGRIDHQVKIRGFRIELGEIENRLTGHENIKEAIVIDREDNTGEKYLCAYIVFQENTGSDQAELKSYLSQTLPQYMIPAHFVKIEKIPLSPNGKLNRKDLPEPGAKPDSEYVAPGNDKEWEIAEIWKQVLGLEKVSIDDNFFDAGGNSLKIVKLAIELRKHLGKEIPTAKMFQYTTIASQARYIDMDWANEKEEEEAVAFGTGQVKNKLKQRRDKIRR
ncbi:MAG TPA: amino acid adenylation domain-containing protein, partial [Candidatus Deferrimicrobium sp.]|nr:amino acid adenylation domain-containing protein [Candidatus Deferrimicrobium sp.]